MKTFKDLVKNHFFFHSNGSKNKPDIVGLFDVWFEAKLSCKKQQKFSLFFKKKSKLLKKNLKFLLESSIAFEGKTQKLKKLEIIEIPLLCSNSLVLLYFFMLLRRKTSKVTFVQ